LAILASLASARTAQLLAQGAAQADALTSGYSIAFLVGGLSAVAASALVLFGLRTQKAQPHAAPAQ
jgi:hypothetical protein